MISFFGMVLIIYSDVYNLFLLKIDQKKRVLYFLKKVK